MSPLIQELAVVICTRNRRERLLAVVQMLGAQISWPSLLVIVDSSDVPVDPDSVAKAFGEASPAPRVAVVPALPGLPHQRNVGIAEVKRIGEGIKQYCFIDDDIRFESTFLRNGSALLGELTDAVCIGAFDILWGETSSAARTKQSHQGRILKTGVAIPSVPNGRVNEVSWTPGFVMFIPSWVLDRISFRGEVRMYGEDVEFQLRASKFGRIFNSSELPILHDYAPQGRDNYRNIQAYYDGFRWNQARSQPRTYKRSSILANVLLLFAFECFVATFRNSPVGFEGAKGHLDFLRRLVVGDELEQKVSHLEWIRYQVNQ